MFNSYTTTMCTSLPGQLERLIAWKDERECVEGREEHPQGTTDTASSQDEEDEEEEDDEEDAEEGEEEEEDDEGGDQEKDIEQDSVQTT